MKEKESTCWLEKKSVAFTKLLAHRRWGVTGHNCISNSQAQVCPIIRAVNRA